MDYTANLAEDYFDESVVLQSAVTFLPIEENRGVDCYMFNVMERLIDLDRSQLVSIYKHKTWLSKTMNDKMPNLL